MSLPPLAPLPATPHPAPRNIVNAGNSCYLDAVLVALFADFDAWDGLLHASSHPFVPHLRTVATLLRTGSQVTRPTVRALRDAVIDSGWRVGTAQQDAAELLAHLLDALSAPYLPLVKSLSHHAAPDAADYASFTERILWLDVKSPTDNHLREMLDAYFFQEVIEGLRRGGEGVNARVRKSLIPFYTPVRETGETVSVTRDRFDCLTVPLAINRFGAGLHRKDRSPVSLPTAIPAAAYVQAPRNSPNYTLMLRSVICHRGDTLKSGHYVTYTYSPSVGWRRWDDLSSDTVPSVRGNVRSGAPENSRWTEEISRDAYLVFYELVPGDGEIAAGRDLSEKKRRQIRTDAYLAQQQQAEADCEAALHEQLMNGGVVFDVTPVLSGPPPRINEWEPAASDSTSAFDSASELSLGDIPIIRARISEIHPTTTTENDTRDHDGHREPADREESPPCQHHDTGRGR